MGDLNFELTEKQASALNSHATEIVYGGAAGGGKSFLMRIAAIIWAAEIAHLQVYLFRRLSPDLVKTHMEGPNGLRALLKPWEDAGLVKIVREEIRFWNGSKIFLCHCQEEKDKFKYLGPEIHVLLIDELTQFTDSIYRFIRGRVRAIGLKIPEKYALPKHMWADPNRKEYSFPRILCATNPGNIGHGWVKRAFIDNRVPYELERVGDSEGGMIRQYIPARLGDNPYLLKDSPGYRQALRGLGNAALVKAYEEGDWNIVVGAYFADFSLLRHVIKPFTIPASWARVRGFDWGWSDPFCVQWWAVSDGSISGIPKGCFVCYREWYGASEPNQGLKLSPKQIAKGILEREAQGETFIQAVADPSIFHKDRGPSIADQFRRDGVFWTRASRDRAAGWAEFTQRLRGDEDGYPMALWFETCVNSIRTIPAVQHDDKNPNDLNTKSEDHAVDTTRYCFMTRTYQPPSMEAKTRKIKTLREMTYDDLLKIHGMAKSRKGVRRL